MIPYSRPKLPDLYTLSRSKLFENTPFIVAHTYTVHIYIISGSIHAGENEKRENLKKNTCYKCFEHVQKFL